MEGRFRQERVSLLHVACLIFLFSQALLELLSRETGRGLPKAPFGSLRRPLPPATIKHEEPRPLTEEDILRQPFYTVVEEEERQALDNGEASFDLRDYRYKSDQRWRSLRFINIFSDRTLLTEMLLSLRITSPARLTGRRLGEHLSTGLDWSGNQSLGREVGRTLRTGMHSSLCLAHGRRPILSVRLAEQQRAQTISIVLGF